MAITSRELALLRRIKELKDIIKEYDDMRYREIMGKGYKERGSNVIKRPSDTDEELAGKTDRELRDMKARIEKEQQRRLNI